MMPVQGVRPPYVRRPSERWGAVGELARGRVPSQVAIAGSQAFELRALEPPRAGCALRRSIRRARRGWESSRSGWDRDSARGRQ